MDRDQCRGFPATRPLNECDSGELTLADLVDVGRTGIDLEPAILDTLARVYFEQGDIKKAVQWQRKAVENAPEGRMADDLKEALKRYEAAM